MEPAPCFLAQNGVSIIFVVVVVVVVVVVGGGGGEHHLCFVGGLKVQNDFVSPVANKWIREGAQIWRRPCSLSKD